MIMNKIKVVSLLSLILLQVSLSGVQAGPADSVDLVLYEPSYDYEYVPDASYELMRDRISCMQKDFPMNFNGSVKSFIDYFTIRDRSYSHLMVQRKNLYFPIFEKYLKKYGLPEDLKYLSIVESGLNPQAKSRVGAVGLWQFMPSTGRLFGLSQDWYVDERMDPEKSTEAACKYLKQLYNMFDDWELALAAYNTGPGNVRKAIKRSGYKRDFWAIYQYLPRETRSYVPQFVAVAYTMNHIEEHNLHVETAEYAIETDTILVSQFISLKALSEQINVCEEDLARLNPELRRNAVPETAKNYALIIPADKYDLMAAHRSVLLDSAGNQEIKKEFAQIAQKVSDDTYEKEKVVYKVRSGDVLGTIAARHGVSLSDLKSWNHLKGNKIYAGQRLTIWTKPSAAPPKLASNSVKKASGSASGSETYVVQSGDSLWEISKKYEGLSVEKIKQLNNLKSNSIKPGQKLVVGR